MVVQPQNNIGLGSGIIDDYALSPSPSGGIISPKLCYNKDEYLVNIFRKK